MSEAALTHKNTLAVSPVEAWLANCTPWISPADTPPGGVRMIGLTAERGSCGSCDSCVCHADLRSSLSQYRLPRSARPAA